MTKKPVIIVGGGIAGLSSGVTLLQNGVQPLLIERRPYLGGRATTQPTSPPLDNGPHLVTAGYRHLQSILRSVGKPLLFDQSDSRIRWYDSDNQAHSLIGGSRGRMFLSFLSEFGWNGISLLYRLMTLSSYQECQTVGDWLKTVRLPEKSDRLLRLFVVSTMNTEADEADFGLFRTIIRESLLSKTKGSILQRFTPLESTLISPLREYFLKHGGELLPGKPVENIVRSESGWLVTCGTDTIPTEQVVLALPSHQRALFVDEDESSSSPIVTVRLSVTGIEPGWFGFLEGDVHWVFISNDSPRLLEAVTSANVGWAGRDRDAMVSIVMAQLQKIAPSIRLKTVFGVVKELHATPKQTPAWVATRKGPATGKAGLWRSGDDLATGLPATIESAVKAGIWSSYCVLGKVRGEAGEACSSVFDSVV